MQMNHKSAILFSIITLAFLVDFLYLVYQYKNKK